MECAVKERSAGTKGLERYVIVAEGRVCVGLLSALCSYVRSSGRANSYSPHCPIFCSPPLLLFPSHVITTLHYCLCSISVLFKILNDIIVYIVYAEWCRKIHYIFICFVLLINICPWLCCLIFQKDIMPKYTSNIRPCLLVG